MSHEPAANLVKSGDYVKTVNDEVVEDKEDLIEKMNQCQGEPVWYLVGTKTDNISGLVVRL